MRLSLLFLILAMTGCHDCGLTNAVGSVSATGVAYVVAEGFREPEGPSDYHMNPESEVTPQTASSQ